MRVSNRIAACKSLGAFLIAADLQSGSLKSMEEISFAAESQAKQRSWKESIFTFFNHFRL
ncbi:hypothetical protein ABKV19_009190, partial [Rosa sericea]